jgi:class 3 adenylate cyclase
MRYLPLLLLVFITGCRSSQHLKPQAHKGVIDLSAWNFDSNGMITLDGEWKFYPMQLLTPVELARYDSTAIPQFLAVPGYWNGQYGMSGYGYGTYVLTVKLPAAITADQLAIKVLGAGTAYSLWANDQLIAANGVVSTDPAKMSPMAQSQVRSFGTSLHELRLLVQVSNNFHSKGGFWESVVIGKQPDIYLSRDVQVFTQVFILGALFILFIYHLGIFFLRRSETAALIFGLMCIALVMRLISVQDRFIFVLFPGISFSLVTRIEYMSMPLCITAFGFFLHSLFPKDLTRIHLKVITIVAVLQIALILFTPASFYTSQVMWLQVFVVGSTLFYFGAIFKSMLRKRKLATLSFASYCFMAMAAVNDVLYARLIINTTYVVHLAFFIFMVVQAYILAYRISRAFNSVENLSHELNDANINLENKVADRTRELEQEKKKSDDLLLNILPSQTAEELKQTGFSEAKQFNDVSVFFSDFVNFTGQSETMSPDELVGELHNCFKAFDEITARHNIEKIKTIGDAYLSAGGLPNPDERHALNVVNAALEILEFMKARRVLLGNKTFDIRIGIHTGSVVAGIVGVRKFAYDIWGDAVNTAARMEQSSEPGRINISEATYNMVKHQFDCTYRGEIEAKNKGRLKMYFVEAKTNALAAS